MVQIVKGKKKGRPSKADLATRATVLAPASAKDCERRRSSRRRNVRYDSFVDYDDYLDEYEDLLEQERGVGEDEGIEDEEEERGKEKKLRLVLNLHVEKRGRGRKRGRRSSVARVLDGDEEREEKPLTKKRRVNEIEEEEQEYRRNEEDEDEDEDEEEEGRGGRKCDHGGGGGGEDSAPGTPPSELAKELPLPDKKALELILAKLQKKDVYGAYAEPVDLDELPDYLDVVDHPMDFSTVRKKLANGSYATMEQFESDVFLICSNAMQYNASDTVFYKQARTIQELAKRKFKKIRTKIERSERAERETKSEQKTKTNSLVKKQMNKPFRQVGSDFSLGATVATPVDAQNGSFVAHGGGCERSINNDVLVEKSAIADNSIEKVEELSSGKGSLTKLGKKSSLLEERRATCNIPNHPTVTSESIFTTFDSEIKQLVAVGLHADYSYARSLARFAATLGPVAWKVASQKIERALPPGYKYGRGWVGEYEPLPTPVLMPEACNRNESIFSTKFHFPSDNQDGNVTRRALELGQENLVTRRALELGQENLSKWHTSEVKSVLPNPSSRPSSSDGKPPSSSSRTRPSTPVSPSCRQQNLSLKSFGETKNKNTILHAAHTPVVDGNSPADCSSESKNVAVASPSSYQQQNLPPPRNFPEKRKKSPKLVELNLPPSSNYNDPDVGEKKHPSKSEIPPLKSREASGKKGHLNSVVPKQYDGVGVSSRGLSNGKAATSSSSSKMVSSSADGTHNTVSRPATHFPHQGLTDPVEAIRMSTQKAQHQQKSSNLSSIDKPAVPSVPSVRNDAAVTAARAWMSIGAGGYGIAAENSVASKGQFPVESLYNPTWQLRPNVFRVQGQFSFPAGMQVPSEKNNFPFQAFKPQPLHAADGAHFQNRQMIFPQLLATDLSRFQMQSPWGGLSPQGQPKQKPDTLPPDLNIRFQSPGSPGKQSSGPMADLQQPDLALQL